MTPDDKIKLQAEFSKFLCKADICNLINVHAWKDDKERAYFMVTVAKPSHDSIYQPPKDQVPPEKTL